MTLIGYWPLNETEGDTVYDYSGNENHGDLLSGVSQDGEELLGESSYEFDGTSDGAVECSLDQNVHGGMDGLTLCGWVYARGFSQSTWHPLTVNVSDSSNSDWGYGLLYNSDDSYIRPHTRTEEGRSNSPDFTFLFNLGEWYHVAQVYDGEKHLVYVNGELLGTGGSISGKVFTPDTPISIGHSWRNRGSAEDQYWDGFQMDQRIYNRGLSTSEVQYLYNVGRRGRFVSRKKQP